MLNYSTVSKCRLCGNEGLEDLFSLGDIHISTFTDKADDSVGSAPMTMCYCGNCTLAQLRESVPMDILYSNHYWYQSKLNQDIVNDLKNIVDSVTEIVDIENGDSWLDIGANDGTLLKFVDPLFKRVGVEPARNFKEELESNCDVVINDFWSADKVDGKFKVVTAIGMFYDLEDPMKFIGDIKKVLADNGIFVAQLMTTKSMLEKNDVGNICHEHIEYYSYQSLLYLFQNNGLDIFKVEENNINGGSYRIYATHKKHGSIIKNEYIDKQTYLDFYKRIQKNKEQCVAFIREEVIKGKQIYGYGASTKGNTILQWYGLGADDIRGIAEIHPEKLGKFTVGTGIPILAESEAKSQADYLLVLPYAFRENFIKREAEWLSKGGKFIFSTPKFEIYAQ